VPMDGTPEVRPGGGYVGRPSGSRREPDCEQAPSALCCRLLDSKRVVALLELGVVARRGESRPEREWAARTYDRWTSVRPV